MEHAQQLRAPFPWRTAAVVCGGIALVELLALIAVGAIHLRPRAPHAPVAAAKTTAAAATHVRAPVHAPAPPPAQPLRARSALSVLVLNGNGVQGAASAEAARLHADGYRRGTAANAPRHDYARSMVLYAPGYAAEARRLARDAGVRLVAPVDGIAPGRLRTEKLILILGT